MARILALEPEIMRDLNYHLTIHCPYRPFEVRIFSTPLENMLIHVLFNYIREMAMQNIPLMPSFIR